MSFDTGFLDLIRSRISLQNIVSRRVKLTKRGNEYTGLCPFHKEKTPSFTVSEEKGFYHCFGCGAHGDAISFLVDCEKMPFPEAVEYLANSVGLSMPENKTEEQKDRQKISRLFDIMEQACLYFEKCLSSPKGAEAQKYLFHRGLNEKVIKTFRLGYAPRDNSLFKYLLNKGYSEEELMGVGLMGKSNNPPHLGYDYFRDRIIFPIMDQKGRVNAFGGRVMDKSEPKYLNSPETLIFKKGFQVYGLSLAKNRIREKGAVLLVEGYMDVIALHQAGIENVVAPLGTALTENQLSLLWKSVDEPLICFDGDNAGQRAAIRAMNRALPMIRAGKSLKFCFLPNKMDPDEFIRQRGVDEFRRFLMTSIPLSDLLFRHIMDMYPLTTPEKKALAQTEIEKNCYLIKDEKVRRFYLEHLMNLFGQNVKGGQKKHPQTPVVKRLKMPADENEKIMMAYIIKYPTVCARYLEGILALEYQSDLFGQIMSLLIDGCRDFKSALTESQWRVVFPAVEALNFHAKSTDEIAHEIEQKLSALSIKKLQSEIEALWVEYRQNPTTELLEKINLLKEEKQNLLDVL